MFPLYNDRFTNEMLECLRLLCLTEDDRGAAPLESLRLNEFFSTENEARLRPRTVCSFLFFRLRSPPLPTLVCPPLLTGRALPPFPSSPFFFFSMLLFLLRHSSSSPFFFSHLHPSSQPLRNRMTSVSCFRGSLFTHHLPTASLPCSAASFAVPSRSSSITVFSRAAVSPKPRSGPFQRQKLKKAVYEAIKAASEAALARYPTTEEEDTALMADRRMFNALPATARNAIRCRHHRCACVTRFFIPCLERSPQLVRRRDFDRRVCFECSRRA